MLLLAAALPLRVSPVASDFGTFSKAVDANMEHARSTAQVTTGFLASNPALRSTLLSTGDAYIAEASIKDTVWGIGLRLGDPRVKDPRKWKGGNLLGRTLMQVREKLKKDDEIRKH